MKRIQMIPRDDLSSYGAFVQREAGLCKAKRDTFGRAGSPKWDMAAWVDKDEKHVGQIRLTRGLGGVVVGEVKSRVDDWQIFHAFLSFIARESRDNMSAISTQFVE